MLDFLMRGGSFGHYWFKQSRRTTWWPTNAPKDVPIIEEDAYFGVHPSKVSKSPTDATRLTDIEAINCLYADIDIKEFGSKTATAEHIKQLHPSPSIIVDSGGGYHCYWLLEEPFTLDSDFMREAAQAIQKRWVSFVKGDAAVHDLARILRIPGTLNYKYKPPRQVRQVYSNLERTYTLESLETFLPSDEHRGDVEDSRVKIPVVGSPNQLSLQEVVDKAKAAHDGGKFGMLWMGGQDGFESASEGDLALCCILAFWTGGDYVKIDKIFRASDRMRPKWDREKYRHDTLLKALGQVTKHYHDPSGLLTAAASDEGNALCAYAKCKGTHLFCGALGWMSFNGKYWEHEVAEASTELMIMRLFKERRIAASGATEDQLNPKYREAILRVTKGSTANRRNCMAQLKSLATVPISSFDTSLDELNCPNGVLNLRTGKLTSHSAAKRFTYCLAVPYDKAANQTPWKEWLLEAVGGHPEVADFLQLAVGYSLTGHIREEIAFYLFGPARSGKGIFVETLIHMMGNFNIATEVGMDMFLEKRRSGDQGFGLASLKSARFVAASETKESHWLDASKIKTWTGGNIIRCAHKYGKQFSYTPQFKIWLTSNFMIQMDADDTAGWARMQVINFPNSYLGREDKLLKQYMRSSTVLEGVLAWAVEGAMRWYQLSKGGLRAPKRIKDSTDRARSDLDWVAQWVEQEIIVTGGAKDKLSNAAYYTRYADWCQERGVIAKKSTALNKVLKRSGYQVGLNFTCNGKSDRGWFGARFVGSSMREGLADLRGKEMK